MNSLNPLVFCTPESPLVTFLASYLIWFMFAGIFMLWAIDGRIKKEQAIHAFFATVLVYVICEMFKNFFPTLRPFQTNGFPPLTLTIPKDGGFPSVHAAVSAAIAVSVWLHNKKIGLGFIVMAILVSLGRILSNVHGIWDVTFGIFLGFMTSFILEKLHFTKLVK